jgi:EmrB/QacA subfamily drug resistance transporter
MIFLDATIVNVALPDIQSDFDAGEQGLQWVVAAYSLTMAMFIMSAATLADQRGRRITMLAGTALFSVASALCGLAPSLMVLNVGRGLQGVGAAIVNVASLALVSAAFPNPKRKARAIGIWTGIASLGLAIGPTVGGFLTESIGWRSIFFVNVFIGGLTVVLVRAFVTESKDPRPRDLDLPGQVLFIVAVGALTYALIEGPQAGWLSPEILGLLVGSVAAVAIFVVVELRSRDPMMDVRVFKDRVYTVAILTLFVVLFCVYGLLMIITQYFQNVQDRSPEQTGVIMLAFTLPALILAPVAGNLAAKQGGRRPTLGGVAILALGMLTVAIGVGGPLAIVVAGLVLVGSAAGLAISPATNEAMSSIPADRAGMASGIMSAQRALGSTAGFAIMGSILAAVVASTLPARFEPYLSGQELDDAVAVVVDDANPQAVVSIIGPGKPLPDDVAEEDELVQAADDSFVEGIRVALSVGLVLAVLVLIAGVIVFPKGARDEGDELAEAKQLQAEEAGSA